jgi:hypothetical protein
MKGNDMTIYAPPSRCTLLTIEELEADREAIEAALEAHGIRKQHPFDGLRGLIHSDPEYAWGFHCNLTMPIYDVASVPIDRANQASALIMAQMFGYDITRHPRYVFEKNPHQEYFEARIAAEREEDAALAKKREALEQTPVQGDEQ